MALDERFRKWLSSLSMQEFQAFLVLCQAEISKDFPSSDEEIDAIDQSTLPEIPEALNDPMSFRKDAEKVVEVAQPEEVDDELSEAAGFRTGESVSDETEAEIKRILDETYREDDKKNQTD